MGSLAHDKVDVADMGRMGSQRRTFFFLRTPLRELVTKSDVTSSPLES